MTVGFDSIPWQNDNVALPAGVTCNNSTYQISAKGATLGYFLPGNGGSSGQAGVCFTNPNGTTNVYYGGWASPYTDNYATDPFFTTQISQGMADRRAPGTSWKVRRDVHVDQQALDLHRERRVVQLRQRARR